MVPTPRFWILFALGAPLAVLAASNTAYLWLMVIFDAALVGLALGDRSNSIRPHQITIARLHEPVLSIVARNVISLEVTNESRQPVTLRVRDEPPALFAPERREFAFTLQPRETRVATYGVTSRRRGDYLFNDVYVRALSPMSLVWVPHRIAAKENVKVYPNVIALRRYDLLRHRGHLREIGIRRSRLRGVGNEFESLRDYTPDDDFRQIDWKATARRARPIVRQYEAERSQSVFLVIDAGRNMLAEIDGITKLDHVMNAALMLGYAAAYADDRLGLLTFDDSVLRYLPPKRGRGQVEAIMNSLYSVQAGPVEPNYPVAFAYLSRRWAKRSLVVAFTDLQEADSAEGLITALAALARVHRCVCVTVADPDLHALATAPITDSASVYTRAVALQVQHDRRAAIRRLKQRGVAVIDSEPDTLARDLVNFYMAQKARGAI